MFILNSTTETAGCDLKLIEHTLNMYNFGYRIMASLCHNFHDSRWRCGLPHIMWRPWSTIFCQIYPTGPLPWVHNFYTTRITSQLKSVESTCPYRSAWVSLGGNLSGHVTLRSRRNLPEESNGATACAVQICRNRQFPQLKPKNVGAQGYSAVHVRLSLWHSKRETYRPIVSTEEFQAIQRNNLEWTSILTRIHYFNETLTCI